MILLIMFRIEVLFYHMRNHHVSHWAAQNCRLLLILSHQWLDLWQRLLQLNPILYRDTLQELLLHILRERNKVAQRYVALSEYEINYRLWFVKLYLVLRLILLVIFILSRIAHLHLCRIDGVVWVILLCVVVVYHLKILVEVYFSIHFLLLLLKLKELLKDFTVAVFT